MSTDIKKIMIYSGGAILIGAIGYFVYSFFTKQPVSIGSATISLGDSNIKEEADGTSASNIGTDPDFGSINSPSLLDKTYTVYDLKGIKIK